MKISHRARIELRFSDLDIVAVLPDDIGSSIRIAADTTYEIRPAECDHAECRHSAVAVVAGEQDSFGFEPLPLCEAHLKMCLAEVRASQSGEDVEARVPAEGHIFVVSEGTNHDGHGDWLRGFHSFQEATGFYRQIEDSAARWCGLYPGQGVREWTLAKFEQVQQQQRNYLRDLHEADREYEMWH
jgi:hypothetical protein